MEDSLVYARPQSSDAAPALQPLHLIEEITHRVVNEYTEAICSLALAAAASPTVQAQMTLTSAALRLRAQVEAHRALQAPFSDGPLDLAEYVTRLCERLTKAPLTENGVRLAVSTEQIWLDADRSWRVGLIVAELIRNAVRHGLGGKPGSIWVELAEATDRISCSVCNDGGGALTERVGRGRQLVQALAGELGGEVTWTFAPSGCLARLDFPTNRPASVGLQDRSASVVHVPLFSHAVTDRCLR